MRVQPTLNLRETKGNWFVLQQAWQQLVQAFNNKVGFGRILLGSNITLGAAATGKNTDNIDGVWVYVATPGTANTDFTVTHNLTRPVTGYWIMQKSGACDLYTSPSANASPNTQFIFRATVASVDLLIFLV